MRVRIASPTFLVTCGNWVIWNSKNNHEWRGNYYYTHHWHSFFHTYIVTMATVSTKCVFTRNIRYHSVVLLNIETGKCYCMAIIHDHDSCPCHTRCTILEEMIRIYHLPRSIHMSHHGTKPQRGKIRKQLDVGSRTAVLQLLAKAPPRHHRLGILRGLAVIVVKGRCCPYGQPEMKPSHLLWCP